MRRPGFTLVEVVIVTLFITLCVWTGRRGYSWYVRSSRADAAETFVQQVAAAQRAYLSKSARFVGIHKGRLDAYPGPIPTEGAVIDKLPAGFLELEGVEVPESPFFFRVAVLAGEQDAPSAELLKDSALVPFPVTKKPWFYIVAFADQDGDGEFSKLEASSWDDNGVVQTARTE
jgi:type II secretory pathway pseudopilin PulG